ncbi:MAG: hypothetical protein SO131_06635 [Prevotella sp.]|nr:hypothetical protein [Prevotella sp.]
MAATLCDRGIWAVHGCQTKNSPLSLGHTDTGSRENVTADSQGQFTISFSANESIFVTF